MKIVCVLVLGATVVAGCSAEKEPQSADLTTGRGPNVCATVYQPVCGADGQTYSNTCVAVSAGVQIVKDHACATLDPGDTRLADRYRVLSIGDQPVLEGTDVSIELDGEGNVAGSTGCNRFTTAMTPGLPTLFGPVGTTRKLCSNPPGIMEQERRFVDILEAAIALDKAEGEGDSIVIHGRDGELVAEAL